jgi:hypothetical protein
MIWDVYMIYEDKAFGIGLAGKGVGSVYGKMGCITRTTHLKTNLESMHRRYDRHR